MNVSSPQWLDFMIDCLSLNLCALEPLASLAGARSSLVARSKFVVGSVLCQQLIPRISDGVVTETVGLTLSETQPGNWLVRTLRCLMTDVTCAMPLECVNDPASLIRQM